MPTPHPPADRTLETAATDAPLAVEVLARLPVVLKATDIIRGLGYPAGTEASPRVVESAERIIAEAQTWLRPKGIFAVYAIADLAPRALRIGGATIRGDVGDFLRGSRRVAVFMVTAGGEIKERAEAAARRGDAFGGLALDTAGSWAAEAAAEALTARLAAHLEPGESFTLRYSPGYCGMALEEQKTLFRLAPAERVGITLLPSLLMQPLKSISGIIGMGPQELVGVHLSPCERCPQPGCHMRR
jgi:Vitamin B12 dependent methionine synthase, activation domain